MSIFELELRTLRLKDYKGPETRNEAFDLNENDLITIESCVEKVSENPGLFLAFEEIYDDWYFEKEKLAKKRGLSFGWDIDFLRNADYEGARENSLKYWLKSISKDEFLSLLGELDFWLSQSYTHSDFEECYDHTLGYPADAYEAAYDFFRIRPNLCDDLGVELIESETFGSNYIAAELTTSIEKANQRAKDLNHEIIFIKLR